MTKLTRLQKCIRALTLICFLWSIAALIPATILLQKKEVGEGSCTVSAEDGNYSCQSAPCQTCTFYVCFDKATIELDSGENKTCRGCFLDPRFNHTVIEVEEVQSTCERVAENLLQARISSCIITESGECKEEEDYAAYEFFIAKILLIVAGVSLLCSMCCFCVVVEFDRRHLWGIFRGCGPC
mmetsp:Transcript_425/g.328  ORF Transcript_425/g.328 Transcript_425/m.328 type:complete len:183 (+) Transcript_425:42-590(+)